MIKKELIKVRESKDREGFGFSYIQRIEEPLPVKIGNSGLSDLTSVIYGYSVGLKSLYSEFLPRIIDWLRKGIADEESFIDFNYHQCSLTSALALSYWISTGETNISFWKDSIYWQEQVNLSIDYSVPMGREAKEDLALSILRYIQAKEYHKAIKFYEQANSALGKPFKFSAKLTSYNLAYAYCLHFAEGMFSVEELEKAGRVFLEKHLQALYTSGRSIEMLYWLKTICDAREKDYTPEEVIYTFYEFVKDEDKPDFVKELLNK